MSPYNQAKATHTLSVEYKIPGMVANACQACKTCTTYRSRAAKQFHIKLDLIAIMLTEGLALCKKYLPCGSALVTAENKLTGMDTSANKC